MDFSTELPHEVNVVLVLFRSNRVKIVSQQHTVRVCPRTQTQQKLTEFHGCSIAALPSQDVDIFDQTLTKSLV